MPTLFSRLLTVGIAACLVNPIAWAEVPDQQSFQTNALANLDPWITQPKLNSSGVREARSLGSRMAAVAAVSGLTLATILHPQAQGNAPVPIPFRTLSLPAAIPPAQNLFIGPDGYSR